MEVNAYWEVVRETSSSSQQGGVAQRTSPSNTVVNTLHKYNYPNPTKLSRYFYPNSVIPSSSYLGT